MIQAPLAALSPNSDFVTACYIVAFSLFIFGIRQGTHPSTARRGNLIAAAGMLIAIAIAIPAAAIRLPRRAVVGRVPCPTPKMKSEKATT